MTAQFLDGLQDAELSRCLQNKMVEKLEIRENEKSRYEVHATLKWNSGVLPVITTKGKTREWASLDRLVKHLKTNIYSVSIDWHLKISTP